MSENHPPNRAGIRAFLRGSIPGSPTKTRGNGEFELAANGVQAVDYRCEVIGGPWRRDPANACAVAERKAGQRRGESMKVRAVSKSSADEGSAAVRTALVCALWAIVHSLLASKQAKDLARRIVGPRYRDGLYRLAYNAQSVLTLAWAAGWFLRQPDRELYRATPPLSWLLRAGQVASLGVLFSGIRVVGFLDFAGLRPLWGLVAGREPRPEPEAQGPPIGADGEMAAAGAFRFTRHPGNLGALGFFVLFPRMTANRAVLAALVALHVVVGSAHEEHRLRSAYGAPFERYRRRVPFLIPRPPRG